MAITEERLKEMEEEMNRFEEEISTVQPPMGRGRGRPGGPPKMIIGSNTYNQVQARLTHTDDIPEAPVCRTPAGVHDGPPDDEFVDTVGPPPQPPPLHPAPAAAPQIAFPALPPPPPPPLDVGPATSGIGPSVLPPPPPPASRPAFVPHQIRHRPPPPPSGGRPPFYPQGMPPRPPMGGPPRCMPPPPPPNMRGPPPGPPHGPFMHGPGPGGMRPPPGAGGMPPHGPGGMHGPGIPPPPMPYNPLYSGPRAPSMPPPLKQSTAVIEGPKVVYSSPPVKNVPKTSAPTVTAPPVITTLVEPVKPEKVDEPEPEPIVIPEVSSPLEMDDQSITGAAAGDMSMDTDDASKRDKKEKKKKYMRTAAGIQWEDPTLADWDTEDFRIFCGDLGNEVTEEILARAFSKYPSFQKAKVVRDKRTNKTRGYGFIALSDPSDFVRAMREMNGKYVGNRPIKLRKSCWKDRNSEIVKKKEKEKKRLGFR